MRMLLQTARSLDHLQNATPSRQDPFKQVHVSSNYIGNINMLARRNPLGQVDVILTLGCSLQGS